MTGPDTAAGAGSRDEDPRRQELARWLVAHEPVDEREAASLTTARRLLPTLAAPFDRDAGPVHVTASAVVVGPRGVLLHRHRLLGIWMQPGGHVDGAEELRDAAVREVVEETGLTCTPIAPAPVHLDAHAGARCDLHLDVRFALWHPGGTPRPAPGESRAIRWVAWPDAHDLADAGLRGALVRVEAMLRADAPAPGDPKN